MKLDGKKLIATSAVWILCLLTGCTSRGPTRLCDGFQSYETPREARSKIGQVVAAEQWKEEEKGTAPSDPRPPYHFLAMSGPFRLSGIDGRLKLTFYNDRLMSTEFSTASGQEFLAKLRERGGKVPADARKEVIVDRHTRLRYDIDPDGTYRFSWTDAKLEDEWLEWVRQNA